VFAKIMKLRCFGKNRTFKSVCHLDAEKQLLCASNSMEVL